MVTHSTRCASLPAQTAGLVVATRLSEDPAVSVLVLEAGPANLDDDSISMSRPSFNSFLLSLCARSHVRHLRQEFFQPKLRVGIHDSAYNIHMRARDATSMSFVASGPSEAQCRQHIFLATVSTPSRLPYYTTTDTWPRSGKGLGGTSSINFYVFTQPPASDIDG